MANKNLYVYQEALSRIADWKKKNNRTVVLDLQNLYLTDLPEEISELDKLERLNLKRNLLKNFPPQLFALKNLNELILSENKLIEIPRHINSLNNLRALWLDNNYLTQIPKELGELEKLYQLQLDNNQFDDIPEEIGKLLSLHYLHLSYNKLKLLPKTLGNLNQLRILSFDRNDIEILPKEFQNLKNLKRLSLLHNTRLNIPIEIVEKYDEPKIILNYYFENVYQVKEADIRPLKEVKVLLVGQGRVGKTSLVRYLIDNEKCNPQEPSTHGIIRNKWKIDVVEEKTKLEQEVQLNIWDFGGQDIQHQTHQFFLNQRSLYLLVLDAGRDEAGNKLDYWLKKIETVGKDAPILIAVNKSEQCLLPLAYTELKEKFNIKGFFDISCETGQQIEELRQTIKTEIGKIENVFEPIRKEWFAVKEYLENLEEDYISRDEYRKICREKGVTEIISQDTLLILLHELGIMLNFKEHETEVLNPEWVTRGVYQMVTSRDVQTNAGILTPELLESEIVKLQEQLVLEKKEYLRYPPEKYIFIKDLMKKFELAYQIDDTENYFVPSLLPKDSPFVGDWNEKECLGFRYNYENGLLHETIMSRFIVKMNSFILDKTQWLTGVLLKNEHGNKALLKSDLSNGYLTILIDGNKNTRREFLANIRMKFAVIHKDNYPKEEIPLKDYPNEYVSYELLLQLEKEGIDESHTTVNGNLVKYNVKELLDSVSTSQKRALEAKIDDLYYGKDDLEHRYQEGIKRGEAIVRQNDKEVDDIVGEYGDEENTENAEENASVAVAHPTQTLFKTLGTLVFTFIVILSSIGMYDYLQKQGYLSEKGFYTALLFTVVFIVVMATFALASMRIIPPDIIPDILKPVFGLISSNKSPENKEENTKLDKI